MELEATGAVVGAVAGAVFGAAAGGEDADEENAITGLGVCC